MLTDAIGFFKGMRIMFKNINIEYGLALFVATIFLLSPGLLFAGVQGYMVTKDNETVLDQKAGQSITWQNRVWFTEKNVRVENTQEKDRLLLIDMEKGKVFQLDNKEKTYRIIDFPEGMKDLYQKGNLESAEMDQTKKCSQWDCYGVKIRTKSKDISLDTEYWLAKEVKIPLALRMKVARYFGPDQLRLAEELGKYEGYPVQTVLSMQVKDKKIKMISNVVEVKKLDIDPKIFEIPPGYKIVEIKTGKEPEVKKGKAKKPEDPNTQEKNPISP